MPDEQVGNSPRHDEDLQALFDAGKLGMETGSDMLSLFRAELQLALVDARRILLVSLLIIPLMLLTWIGSSVLLAWLVYIATQSTGLAILGFVLFQLAGLITIRKLIRIWRRSLTFPASRNQIQSLLSGLQGKAGSGEGAPQ